MKNIQTKWILIGVAVLVIGLFAWSQLEQGSDSEVIAQRGLHWHPQLAIYVKGERIEIPQNIGVGQEYLDKPGYGNGGMAMTPMHTHDDVPIIHLEYQGLVKNEDITLGKFFQVWGKDMRAFGENMRMTVNGKDSTEYEHYIMRDGDNIELHYD